MTTIREMIEQRLAQEFSRENVEPLGPVTLYHMTQLFQEYQRALALAEYNRSGRNPRYPGKVGEKLGATLQAKADRLAESFPAFPEALARLDK